MNDMNHNRFDQALGPLTQTLSLRSRRAELLANNIANSETPGFLARDLDFKQLLARSGAEEGVVSKEMIASNPAHFGGGDDVMRGYESVYRVPTQPSSDGNTVESAVEKAEFAKNTIHYVADLSFLNSRVQGLLKALRGD